jgi:hypothetical protein
MASANVDVPEMVVLRPGTVVQIGPERAISGHVAKVCIEGPAVTYEVVWWSGNERRTAWAQPVELMSSGEQKNDLRIGFLP